MLHSYWIRLDEKERHAQNCGSLKKSFFSHLGVGHFDLKVQLLFVLPAQTCARTEALRTSRGKLFFNTFFWSPIERILPAA